MSTTASPKPSLSATPSDTKPRSPSRAGANPATPTITRTRSVRTTPSAAATARAAGRRPGSKEEDAKAEASAAIEDLKEQLRKSESTSEEHQKQLVVLQSRLDEALAEQTRLEEDSARHADTVEKLKVDLRETQRRTSDLQAELEKEQAASNKEREAASMQEAERQETITRLKESLAQRESRKNSTLDGSISRSASFRGRSSPGLEAPAPTSARDTSQHSHQLLLQKDKIIEDLRLELAEVHLKVMEADRAGGGRMQELERQLLDVRMSNAKLMEDNESYQYLLQERTMSGEMARKFTPIAAVDIANASRAPSRDKGAGSLADELETVGEEDDMADPDKRIVKLEKEVTSQKDQNKALTLYINRIIGRLLANDKFEQLFENGTITGSDNPLSGVAMPPKSNNDKELPVLPSADEEAGKENLAPTGSLLSRAGSIFGARNKGRPTSYQPDVNGSAPPRSSVDGGSGERSTVNAHEDQATAPRVPLYRGNSTRVTGPRGHRRTTSDTPANGNGTVLTGRPPSGGTLSPPLTVSKRSSLTTQSAPRRASSGIGVIATPEEAPSNDIGELPMRPVRTASDSGYAEGADGATSPPRSHAPSTASDGTRQTGGTAIVPGGKQMRPLRLVQEKVEAEEEARKASRTSWMGWLSTKGPAAPANGTNGTPSK